MTQFKVFMPDVEVNGQTVLSIVEGMGTFKSAAFNSLAKNGIPDPKPGQWYSQQAWLNAFQEIADNLGHDTLFNIGKSIPNNADWPKGIKTINDALASIDVAYHMNHRRNGKILFNAETGEMKEGIGHYRFEKISETKDKMICENPYPCYFDKGIIEATAKKFAPEGVNVTVKHIEKDICRINGANCCEYIIEW